MAVLTSVLNVVQRRTLEAICDTVVPSVQSGVEGEETTMREFLARSASEMAVPDQIEGLMGQAMTAEQIQGLAGLFDTLAQHDFASLPIEARTQILHDVAASSHEARLGMLALRNLSFVFFYGLPGELGRTPNWAALGYPGPVSAAPSPEQAPKTIAVQECSGAEQTLTAD